MTWTRGLSSGNALNFRLFVSSEEGHLHQITRYCHVRGTLLSNSCQSEMLWYFFFLNKDNLFSLSSIFKSSGLLLPVHDTVISISNRSS